MTKLYTECRNGRWHFGKYSNYLRRVAWSLNSWSTEREAKAVGKREFSGDKIIWNPLVA